MLRLSCISCEPHSLHLPPRFWQTAPRIHTLLRADVNGEKVACCVSTDISNELDYPAASQLSSLYTGACLSWTGRFWHRFTPLQSGQVGKESLWEGQQQVLDQNVAQDHEIALSAGLVSPVEGCSRTVLARRLGCIQIMKALDSWMWFLCVLLRFKESFGGLCWRPLRSLARDGFIGLPCHVSTP